MKKYQICLIILEIIQVNNMQIVAFLLYSYYLSKWMEGTEALIWQGAYYMALGVSTYSRDMAPVLRSGRLLEEIRFIDEKKCQEIRDLSDGVVEANG